MRNIVKQGIQSRGPALFGLERSSLAHFDRSQDFLDYLHDADDMREAAVVGARID
jgi:hypothetical protein